MSILRNRRGAVAAMSAIVMIGVIGMAGLAVDLTRIWMVNARLKTAIDAASLVGARRISEPQAQRDAIIENIYWANYTQNGRVMGYMLAAANAPVIAQLDANRIQVTGSAVVPTTLFSIIDRRNTTVTDSAIARRQVTGLELALVLDVTGSMASNDNIAALRDAATNLVNRVFDTQMVGTPNVFVSVVPYTAMVNIGPGRTNWLQANSLDANAFLPSQWLGCVEARAGGVNYPVAADEDDTPPSVVGFRPFFWPSNRYSFSFDRDALGAIVRAPNNNPYIWVYRGAGNPPPRVRVYAGGPGAEGLLNTDVPVNRGDNAWIPGAGGNVVRNGNAAWSDAVWEPDPANPGTDAQENARDNNGRGPNTGCGRAVLPLTSDRQTVLDQIAALRATRRGGTMANMGLQLGWGTISPRWRADWALGASWEGQQLPLDYNTRAMDKSIVLMTDGENQWYDWPGGAPGTCTNTGNTNPFNPCTRADRPAPPPVVPLWTNTVDADQNAYGRLANGGPFGNRLGIDNPTAGPGGTAAQDPTNGINARMTRLCQAVRANDPATGRPRNINVFTILFVNNPSAEVANLYRNCASRPANYFLAENQAQLAAAFATIAGQLANLRLLE